MESHSWQTDIRSRNRKVEPGALIDTIIDGAAGEEEEGCLFGVDGEVAVEGGFVWREAKGAEGRGAQPAGREGKGMKTIQQAGVNSC